jgi:hypothetical protein
MENVDNFYNIFSNYFIDLIQNGANLIDDIKNLKILFL